MFSFVRVLDNDTLTHNLLKEFNLRPAGRELPLGPPRAGQPVKNDFFGICSELDPKFNLSKPDCRGKVTMVTRRSKKNERDVLCYYRCGTCRKEISMNNQLYGFKEKSSTINPMTFMAFADTLGRPHTHMTPREILFLLYAAARNWTYKQASFLSHTEFRLAKSTMIDWNHYIRRVICCNRRYQPKIGGPNVVVQIDESLFRGKRKNMTGRLLLGDRGRDARRANYGSRVDGPWIVGMIDAQSRVRLFFVRDRSASTLIPLIRSIVEPGSIIHTDGWAAYGGLGRTEWDDGLAPYQHLIVNHSEEFVAESGAHTQSIERVWTDIKVNFIKVKRSTCKEMFHEWIGYYEWLINTPHDKRFRSLAYLVGMVSNN
jgi:hypothetical protein